MNGFPRFVALVAALLCSIVGLLRAEEQTSTYRVLGLFEPSRQDDLRQLISTIPEVQIANLDYDKAEVTLRYELKDLFPDGKVPKDLTPEKLNQRLTGLFNGKSKGSFTLTTPSTLPADQLTRLDMKVGILDCRGCRYGAYLIVAKMDGVERATVSAETHVLTVWIDPAKTNRDAIVAAIKKAQVSLPPS